MQYEMAASVANNSLAVRTLSGVQTAFTTVRIRKATKAKINALCVCCSYYIIAWAKQSSTKIKSAGALLSCCSAAGASDFLHPQFQELHWA